MLVITVSFRFFLKLKKYLLRTEPYKNPLSKEHSEMEFTKRSLTKIAIPLDLWSVIPLCSYNTLPRKLLGAAVELSNSK